MVYLEQYHNQETLPQAFGYDKTICVPFDKLTTEQKQAFENTLSFQLFVLSKSWRVFILAILKPIKI